MENINVLLDMSMMYKLKVISKTCMTSSPPNILDVMYCLTTCNVRHAWENLKKIIVANKLHESFIFATPWNKQISNLHCWGGNNCDLPWQSFTMFDALKTTIITIEKPPSFFILQSILLVKENKNGWTKLIVVDRKILYTQMQS